MSDSQDRTPKCLQVDADWLGRALLLLEEVREKHPLAGQLLREAPDSIHDRLVSIRRLNLNNPEHLAELMQDRT